MIPRWHARTHAFALPKAGSDYFTTVGHYQSFASRIIAALGGFTVVVVTGDPPPIPQILYRALTVGAQSQYAVTGLSCGPELGRVRAAARLTRAFRPFGRRPHDIRGSPIALTCTSAFRIRRRSPAV